MAAAQPHSAEQHVITSATEDRPEEPAAMKEQTTEVGHEKEAVGQLRSFGSESDLPVYMPNLYAPNAHASYFKGYENFPGEWNELSVYGNTSGWNRESPGIYNHSAALGFHNGYNYNPNVPCGPYCSVTTSMPVVSGDAPLYPSQQYTYSGPTYYQQVVSPSMPHITSQSELNLVVPSDQQVGQRAGYSSSLASSRRGNFTGNLGQLRFQDQQQACDGFRYSGLSSDWPKPSDKHQPRTLGSQQRSFIGFGSRPFSCKESTYERGFSHAFSGGCHGINYGSRCGLENGSLCSCTSASDILTEQNRGPRAFKSQRQILTGSYLYTDSNRDISAGKMRDGSYNHPDFVIEHKDARFFVIKSYSEDNIHRSIKYGVWASTPNGNQKLNAAYHEAKEKLNNCPVFLFFSANASAQFCGVAEMVGPVDFEKSVDYWQQDKWSGQFPVKWHIVKDVPNSQFRHIVLENNDNKPVTNSRDTQEVKLEQGVEMLNIFKNYETSVSILDDFDFYEERQKALQERKSREHTNLLGVGMVGGTEKRNVVTVPNEFIEKMTKSFAQVVQLNPCSKDVSAADRAGRRSDVPLASGQEAETAAVTVSPGVHKT